MFDNFLIAIILMLALYVSYWGVGRMSVWATNRGIMDIRSHDTYAENLENPVAAMMYGFSVLYCMSSALSKPDGAGLGTLGFPPAVCQQMGAEAGFSSFKFLEYEDDPFNNYFELRP